MAQLPRVVGSLSSATLLKFSNINSQLAEMLHLDISPANFTNFGAAWTEVDSGTNVNVDGSGILSMNGSNAYAANGMIGPAITLATGYIEIKVSHQVSPALYHLQIGLRSAAALAGSALALYGFNASATNLYYTAQGANGHSTVPVALTNEYTLRLYISADGKTLKHTIQGGAYTTETECEAAEFLQTPIPNPLYLTLQRYTNAGANLVYARLPKLFFGYSVAAPYVEYVHDAGAGKWFNNFDPSALAMPGTVPSTNLTFKWSFDDGVASYSAALTLAQLNAVAKQTANHRYIRIQVLLNSDGATQVYADKPNSDTATDGIFDPVSEAGRNTDMAASKVELLYDYTTRGTARQGTLSSGLSVPSAVEITSADGIATTTIRVNLEWAANAARLHVERSSSPTGTFAEITGSPITSGNYLDDTVTVGQVWYYRARGYNAAGYGAYGDVVEGTARTSAQIEQALWTLFQTKMQADSYLTTYIGKWKFNKEEAILPATKFPIFKAWILSTREQWISVPKRKIVIPRVIIHGLVKSATVLEAEKLKMDEYIKNAIEADMTFASGVTMNIIGDTIFNNLDDHTAEVFIECEIMSKVFVAGQR